MITRVFLVRHGATTLSAEDRFAGSLDPELSDVGMEQADRLGTRLAREPLTALYSSPLRRAMDTARRIAGERSLPVTPVPEIREIHHGRWEGKTRDEVTQTFGEEYRSWERDPFTFAPTGGESGLMVLVRSLPVFLGLIARHRGESILVVSHKGTIRILIGHLLGFDLRSYRDRLDQSPCGLNLIEVQEEGAARLVLYNDVSHYATVPGHTGKRLSPWWDGA